MARSTIACMTSWLGLLGASASAQPDPNEIMSMYVTVKDIGNGNGVVEPGETARIVLGVSFEPTYGSPANWQSSTPWGTLPGTVECFGSLRFGLFGGNDAESGQLSFKGKAPVEWTSSYKYTKGSIWNVYLRQDPGSILIYDNPLDLMWWDWIPDTYDPRFVDWYGEAWPLATATNKVILKTDLPTGEKGVLVKDIWITLPTGLVGIQVVPAPAAAPGLGLGLLLMNRRRRHA